MTETLKPCPFCGGEAEICHVRDICHSPEDAYWARCKNFSCRMSGRHFYTEAEAIAAWNKRDTHGTLTAEQVHDLEDRVERYRKAAVAAYEVVRLTVERGPLTSDAWAMFKEKMAELGLEAVE